MEDSIAKRIYSKLIIRISRLKIDVEKSGIKNNELTSEIDSLQTYVIKYQSSAIQLKGLEIQVEKFVLKNQKLLSQIEILNKNNASLKDSNESIKNMLNSASHALNVMARENDSFKKSIKLQIAGVSIKAYGHEKALFRKTKLVETNIADKTEYIEVSFLTVPNDKLPKDYYDLTIKLTGVGGMGIKKPCTILYTGKEEKFSRTFNDPDAFAKGYHDVEIKLKDEVLFTGSIELK